MEVSSDYAVQMHGITKVFGSFKALDAVDLNDLPANLGLRPIDSSAACTFSRVALLTF